MNAYVFQMYMFDLATILVYILYIAIAIGLSFNAPQYLSDLQYYMKIYVSVFLMYRFNPLRQIVLSDLDRKIAFLSGVFLFVDVILEKLVVKYIPSNWKIRKIIKNPEH